MARSSKTARHFVINMPLTELKFTDHTSTGKNPQTRPGMGVDFHTQLSYEALKLSPLRDGWYRVPVGVIPRNEVRQLRDFLDTFLRDFPDEVG